jgi:hypothetical protein
MSEVSNNLSPSPSCPLYLVLRSFVKEEEQRQLVQEALSRHRQQTSTIIGCGGKGGDSDDNNNSCNFSFSEHRVSSINQRESNNPCIVDSNKETDIVWESLSTRETSIALHLGVKCGGDLGSVLPLAAHIARQAFTEASNVFGSDSTTSTDTIATIASSTLATLSTTTLSGLVLLYGRCAHMAAHYDSPTQPGQRTEWLVNISLGQPIDFIVGHSNTVRLESGDVLVMDSMAVLHGVERILATESKDNDTDNTNTIGRKQRLHPYQRVGLPINSRLGILFWQGRDSIETRSTDNTHLFREDEPDMDGVDCLFGGRDSDDDS